MTAGKDPNGLNLPPALTTILGSVSSIYLRCLWPAQNRSNREWIRQVKMLNAQYGAEVQADIELVAFMRSIASRPRRFA